MIYLALLLLVFLLFCRVLLVPEMCFYVLMFDVLVIVVVVRFSAKDAFLLHTGVVIVGANTFL